MSRSSVCYRSAPLGARDVELLLAIDKIHTDRPFRGSRWIVDEFEDRGLSVNRKVVQRRIWRVGIEAIFPCQKISRAGVGAGHCVFPYLLAGVPEVFNTDQGSQFASSDFASVLEGHGVAISMDGRPRLLDR